MEKDLFIESFIVLDWLVFTLLALSILYLLVYAIASHFYKTPIFDAPNTTKKFLILIPAYKEDGIIVESTKTILDQSYPVASREVVVIADRMHQTTTNQLEAMGANVFVFEPEESLKSKALIYAMNQYENGSFDAVVILDADNMVEASFLQQLNKACNAGLKAIQTHRTAKKTETNVAILDGFSEEINNAVFRKGHMALGVSSALIGSGMVFPFDWFKGIIGQLATAGEDKELEMILLRENIKVDYLDDVIVYDDKVSGDSTFFNQRRRWLAAQFYILWKSFGEFRKIILINPVDYVDKIIQWMMPPRVVLLGTITVISIIVSFIDLTHAIKWWGLLLMCLAFIGLSLPSFMIKRITLSSLLHLPVLFFLMVANFFRTKGATKIFIHTKKQ